jgi:hypothetical protein
MTSDGADAGFAPYASLPLRWPGFSERGSLVLPLHGFLRAFPMAATRSIDGLALERKQEFHLTLLSRHEGALVRERAPDAEVESCYDTIAWTLGAIGNAWYLVSADAQKWSIVVEFPAAPVNRFRAALSEVCGVALSDTVPHVTLYTAGSSKGIGVESVAEFSALERRAVTVVDS